MSYFKIALPENAPIDEVKSCLYSHVDDVLQPSDIKEVAARFTEIMDIARQHGIADEVKEVYRSVYKSYKEQNPESYDNLTLSELWETPRPLELSVLDEPIPLPQAGFPPFLWEYIKAVAAYVQVFPEMCVLPLLSVLSLCVQDKAVIKDPWNEHTETLNLYSLTIAPPSERKSGTVKAFKSPVVRHVWDFNKSIKHQQELAEYQSRRDLLLSERKTLTSAKKNRDPERLKKVILELQQLKPVTDKMMLADDVTPESLADLMQQNNNTMGIITDEGAVLQVAGGLYSNGVSNIDIYLKAYEGETYTQTRRSQPKIVLDKPLLTMSIMLQPDLFDEIVSNKQFCGRGLIARFLFSLPREKAGHIRHDSPNIPTELKRKYNELIDRLLNLPISDTPIMADWESSRLLANYHDHCQKEQRKGGKFHYGELIKWMGKQFGRCMKLVGILHLCEHEPTETVTWNTTFQAIKLSMWLEGQALKALGSFSEEQYFKEAKYLLSRFEKVEPKFKVRALKRVTIYNKQDGGTQKVYDLLKLLESYGYVEELEPEPFSKKNASPIFMKNPLYM